MATTHLEIIRSAYDLCGIAYVVRTREREGVYWNYLFLVNERRDRAEVDSTPLEQLTRTRRFMEFRNGELASY